MTINSSILQFCKIEIYYTPIKSFWTNIPRHVAIKGHSGMLKLTHLSTTLFFNIIYYPVILKF